MADKSAIEWTDATWNPTVGCSIISPGCTHCYAMKVAHGLERRFGSAKYSGLTRVVNGNAVWTGEVRLDEAALLQPLKWKRGRRIFVNSMSDLFHEALTEADIDRVFAVMALCPQHTFQVLTKRADRMRKYLNFQTSFDRFKKIKWRACFLRPKAFDSRYMEWPLPNVWLGVSAERQAEWDERNEHLRNTPAVVKFVSAEPLIGGIRFHPCRECNHPGDILHWPCPACKGRRFEIPDWVIVGGESGPKARPMHPAWARAIREQCAAAGVPFFFKQRGEYTWIDDGDYDADRIPNLPQNWRERTDDKFICMRADSSRASGYGGDSAEFLYRVGKKAAGRLLDGREHSEFPVTDGSVTKLATASHDSKSEEAASA